MGSFVLIQLIRTVWTKASRGGALATRRNSVPEALPFTARPGCSLSSGILVHRIEFEEADRFEHPALDELEISEGDAVRVLGIIAERLGARVRLTLDLDPVRVEGMPYRRRAIFGLPPPSLTLEEGRWGRASYNFRHVADDGWWYEKVVANIAACEEIDPNVFLEAAPDEELRDLVELW